MNRATFTFYGSLNDFLPRKQRNQPLVRTFDWRGSVKDMVESINVPHPEVTALVVNGEAVDFDYIVAPDDNVQVYPVDVLPDMPYIPLRPALTHKPRFILDTHLGRLAAYLRMAGFDTLYRNDYPDDELAQVAYDEERVLLTRDIGLLKRSLVTHGYFVRELSPLGRLIEIVRRYELADHIGKVMMGRCARCNGTLAQVEKDSVLTLLSDRTASHYDTFYQCQSCEQVYWKGSHYERTESLILEALDKV